MSKKQNTFIDFDLDFNETIKKFNNIEFKNIHENEKLVRATEDDFFIFKSERSVGYLLHKTYNFYNTENEMFVVLEQANIFKENFKSLISDDKKKIIWLFSPIGYAYNYTFILPRIGNKRYELNHLGWVNPLFNKQGAI